MNTLSMLKNTFRDMRKHGCQTVMVTQSLAATAINRALHFRTGSNG